MSQFGIVAFGRLLDVVLPYQAGQAEAQEDESEAADHHVGLEDDDGERKEERGSAPASDAGEHAEQHGVGLLHPNEPAEGPISIAPSMPML